MERGGRRALGAAAIVISAGLTGAVAATTLAAFPTAGKVVFLPAGWAYIGSGLVLWARRPQNRTGLLLVAVGLTFFAALLRDDGQSALAAFGRWASPVFLAFFAYVLLAFPTGRLGSALARGVVLAIFVDLTLVAHAPLVVGDPELATALAKTTLAAGSVLFLAAAALLIRSWSSGSKAWRRAVASVLWPGAISLLALSYYDADAFFTEPDPVSLWTFWIAFALIPFAFMVVLLRVRLARASVAELVVELEQARAAGDLRDALARTLGDPSVSVVYWLPDEQRFVDLAGHGAELPEARRGQVATLVERNGGRIAAILHDQALADEPELLRSVSAAAALVLENERLQAELRAHLKELTASRARIVEATATERKRIERNLHDGTQQRLTSVTMSLGMAEAKLGTDPTVAQAYLQQARRALGVALGELRDFSQGIHPNVLTDGGLRPALEDLAYTTPLRVRVITEPVDLGGRMPAAVEEAAYFVTTEALTNVAKHSQCSAVTVKLSRQDGWLWVSVHDDGVGGADPSHGTGLGGLADRVHALGGSFAVDSQPGAGTSLRAGIPCA